MVKYLIPCIYMYKGRAVTGFGQKNAFGSGNLSEIAMKYNMMHKHFADHIQTA